MISEGCWRGEQCGDLEVLYNLFLIFDKVAWEKNYVVSINDFGPVSGQQCLRFLSPSVGRINQAWDERLLSPCCPSHAPIIFPVLVPASNRILKMSLNTFPPSSSFLFRSNSSVCLLKRLLGPGKVVQGIEVLVHRPDDLSSTLGSHDVAGKRASPKGCPGPYTLTTECMHLHTLINDSLIMI